MLVRITKNPKNDAIFTQSLNADGSAKLDKNDKPFGYIRIVEEKVNLNFAYDGALKTRSALKAMTVDGWEKSKHVIVENLMIDGKIVRLDSLTPGYVGQKCLQAPIKDSKGNNTDKFRDVTSGGQKVYRTDSFTDDLSKVDAILTYDKVATPAIPAKTQTVLAGGEETKVK